MSTPLETRVGYWMAWRMWYVEEKHAGLRLLSLNGTPWPQRDKLVAVCRGHVPVHEAPMVLCKCGIYACRDTWMAAAGIIPPWIVGLIRHKILGVARGQVALWGHVIESEAGFRAQFAYPQVLYTELGAAEGHELGDAYGIDVESHRLLSIRPAHFVTDGAIASHEDSDR